MKISPAMRPHSLIFGTIEPDGHSTGNKGIISNGMLRYFSVLGTYAISPGPARRIKAQAKMRGTEVIGPNVRFGSIAAIQPRPGECPLCAKSGHSIAEICGQTSMVGEYRKPSTR